MSSKRSPKEKAAEIEARCAAYKAGGFEIKHPGFPVGREPLDVMLAYETLDRLSREFPGNKAIQNMANNPQVVYRGYFED